MSLFKKIFRKKEGERKPPRGLREEDLKGLSPFEIALKRVSESPTTKNRREFSSALLETTFYVPLPEKGEPNTITLKTPRKTSVTLKTEEGKEGKILLPVFTSRDLVEERRPESLPLAIPSKDLLVMLAGGGVDILEINPDHHITGEIKFSDLNALAEAAGLKPKESDVSLIMLKDETIIHVSKPFSDLTEEQYDYLRESLSTYPEVLRAYVFTAIFDHGEPQDVVGVCFAGNKMKALSILQSISPGLSKILKPGQKVNFLGFMESPLVEQVEAIISPFYKKG